MARRMRLDHIAHKFNSTAFIKFNIIVQRAGRITLRSNNKIYTVRCISLTGECGDDSGSIVMTGSYLQTVICSRNEVTKTFFPHFRHASFGGSPIN